MKHFITCESALPWHPDKVCDQLADVVLDACLKQDPMSRVACEMLITNKTLVVAGEITTTAKLDVEKLLRKKIVEIGYDSDEKCFNGKTCKIINLLHHQSPDIAVGVNKGGAWDQGIMYGYATSETDQYLPLPFVLANDLAKKLAEVRRKKIIPALYPDGKTQVTVEYHDKKSIRVHAVVVSAQHKKNVDQKKLHEAIIQKVIKPVLGKRMDKKIEIFINPTGVFAIWWPKADTWLTWKKNIIDTYGGRARHGGGSYSGKDCTKVDRSASYMARYLAKHVVASGLAKECEIQISYVIGIKDPVSLDIDCFGTEKIPLQTILAAIQKHFDLTPQGMIKKLGLRKPIFEKTALYGHFSDPKYPREKLSDISFFKKLYRTGL